MIYYRYKCMGKTDRNDIFYDIKATNWKKKLIITY